MTEDRLSRIEKKLDQLAETINIVVRVEERLIHVNKRLDLHETRINSHSDGIDAIREQQIKADSVASWYTAGFWAGIGGIVSIIVSFVTSKF